MLSCYLPTISLRGDGSIKQQTIAGYQYNSTIVHLIFAFVLNAMYHHSAENLFSISSIDTSPSNNSTKYNSTSSFKPKWEDTNLQPYMGNMACVFEVGYWNLQSQKNPRNLDKRRTCGNLRFIPSSNYIPSNIDLVFDKLLSHGENPTIYIVGDSIGRQHSVDLLCYFASESRLVNVDIDPMGKPQEKGCTKNDNCYEDTRDEYSGLGLTGATFQSYNNDTANNHTHNNGLINIMFEGWNKDNLNKFKKTLEKGKHGDIIVINQGLHFSGYEPIVNALNGTYKDTILSAKKRGARIIWR